jgi:molecular chaperone GrpE
MSEQGDDLRRLDGIDSIEGELPSGPEIAEEFWVGDDGAEVIGVDDTDDAEVIDVVDTGAAAGGDDTDVTDGADTDEALADVIDSEIHELASQRDEYKDIAQRLQADFDNYRRRTSTQVAAEVERATGRLAEALLPVLDATEAAYVQHPDEVGPLFNLLLAELRKHGLEPIDLLGKSFDPTLADAVAHEPGDGGEPVVAEVLRSGYLWQGRTLRPAMVRTRD